MPKNQDKESFSYPKGLRLTKDEATFIEGTLLGVAEGAKKEGNAEMFNLAMGLAQRVRQSEVAAQGVPPELQARLQKGLQRAVSSDNPELAQRALENFLATMIRLHPDPARALAVYVVGYINQAVIASIEPAQAASASEAAVQILERYKLKLAGLIDAYNSDMENGWPEASDLFDYLVKWTAAGSEAIEAGNEPWAGDEHLAAALAAAAETGTAGDDDGQG